MSGGWSLISTEPACLALTTIPEVPLVSFMVTTAVTAVQTLPQQPVPTTLTDISALISSAIAIHLSLRVSSTVTTIPVVGLIPVFRVVSMSSYFLCLLYLLRLSFQSHRHMIFYVLCWNQFNDMFLYSFHRFIHIYQPQSAWLATSLL